MIPGAIYNGQGDEHYAIYHHWMSTIWSDLPSAGATKFRRGEFVSYYSSSLPAIIL